MSGSRNASAALDLKAGEWVQVRSREEILATLDGTARLENLPFMSEMLQYCGQRIRVFKRSDKTCDPAHTPWTIRRMKDTVHLEGIRCNGEGHGGCQAGCLIWWNEAWLKRAESDVVPLESLQRAGKESAQPGGPCTVETILSAGQSTNEKGETIYSCQATDIRKFTSYMSWWDPRQYVRDFRSGNLRNGRSVNSISERTLELLLGILEAFRSLFISFFTEHRSLNFPAVTGTLTETPIEKLELQPGELVQVRTKEEIMGTLDKNRRNRGLLFDGEMLHFCGGIYRVRHRVNRIVDERTGQMMHMKNSCIVLNEVACRSDFHRLCPRSIYHYWRENWLQRLPDMPHPEPAEQLQEARKSG